MKKLFVAIALVMGLGTSVALASNATNGIEVSVKVNEFTPIEAKDLPEAVQEAIEKTYPGTTIKEASVEVKEDGASRHYKVILTDKENTETTVFFEENGKEIK